MRVYLNALFLIGQPLLLNLLSIPATAYIIRKLGADGYGQWSVAFSLVATLTFLTNLGLRARFVRAIAQDPESAPEELAVQLALRGLLALAAGAVALFVGAGLRYPDIVLLCIAVASGHLLLTAWSAVMGDLLQGLEQFKAFTLINFLSGLALTAASVLSVWQGAGPLGLSLSYLLGPLTGTAFFALHLYRQGIPVRIAWDPERNRRYLHRSRTLGLNGFLASVQERVEHLAMPKLVGMAEYGTFSAGSMLSGRLRIIPDGLGTSFFPRIARAAKEDGGKASRMALLFLLVSFAVCTLLTLLVSAFAFTIAEILFPENPALCHTVILITIWSLPLYGLRIPMSFILQANGREVESATINIRSTLIGTALAFGMIFQWGVLGASWVPIMRTGLSILFLLPLTLRTLHLTRNPSTPTPEDSPEEALCVHEG